MEKIKVVLTFIFSMATAIDLAKADGKIDGKDIPLIVTPALNLVPALGSAPEAYQSYKALSQAERDEITVWVRQEFNLANDKVEQKIESGLAAVVQLGGVFI